MITNLFFRCFKRRVGPDYALVWEEPARKLESVFTGTFSSDLTDSELPVQLYEHFLNAEPAVNGSCKTLTWNQIEQPRKLYPKEDPRIVKVGIEIKLELRDLNNNQEVTRNENLEPSKFVTKWCSQRVDAGIVIPWLEIKGTFAPWPSFQIIQPEFSSNLFQGRYDLGSFLDFNHFSSHGSFSGDISLKLPDNNPFELMLEHEIDPELFTFEINLRSIVRIITCPATDSIRLFVWLKYPFKIYTRKTENSNVNRKHRVSSCPNINSDVFGNSNILCLEVPLEIGFGLLKIFRCPPISVDVYFSPVVSSNFDNQSSQSSSDLAKLSSGNSFSFLYKWHCFLSIGYSVTDKLETDPETVKLISRTFSNEDYYLLENLDKNFGRTKILFDIKRYVNAWAEKHGNRDLGNGEKDQERINLVRQIILTPTRTIYKPPECEKHNRVLREFGCERALSVALREEDGELIYFRDADKEIIDHLMDRFRTGIHIGNRKYEFLGCSPSQLRTSQSFWFFAADDVIDAERIRSWFGDFSSIRVPAKLLARQGLLFSECRWFLDLTKHGIETKTENDVKGGKDLNGDHYVFSDGVGKISEDVCRLIWKECKIPSSSPPCAIQFRLGGCKGMLVMDPSLPARTIRFRPSQIKFESPHRDLAIIGVNQATRVFLNRPLIMILDQLRKSQNIQNPEFIFEALLQETLLRPLASLLNEESAADWLSALISDFGIPFKGLVENNLSLISDPFFKSILIALYHQQLNLVKKRCRLEIKPEFGRNAFGVMDETGKLNSGQIFFQYSRSLSKNDKEDFNILKGTVLMTKNPCMQMGDVRLFQAVDVKELYHMKNVVVFPSKGERPHPDEMGGSDLDGDEYTLIWDQDLFFHYNEDPMDFPASKAPDFGKTPEINDVISFIGEYFLKHNLGRIANAHLAQADCQPLGLKSEECKKLAQKYSIAVDFQKGGVPASLEFSESPNKYPDFMEKIKKDSYESKSVLGVLYRKANNLTELYREKTKPNVNPDKRILRIFEEFVQTQPKDSEFIWEAAIKSGNRYFYQLTRIPEKQMRYLRPRKKEEIEKIVASAWYKFVYIPGTQRKSYSFPWVAGAALVAILKDSQTAFNMSPSEHQSPSSTHPSLAEESLAQEILEMKPPFQGNTLKRLRKSNELIYDDAIFYLERYPQLYKLYAYICEKCSFHLLEFPPIAALMIHTLQEAGHLESKEAISVRENKVWIFRPRKLELESGNDLIGRCCLEILKKFSSKTIRNELKSYPNGLNEHNLVKLHRNSFNAFQKINVGLSQK